MVNHNNNDGAILDFAREFEQTVGYAFIGMFDDIGGGFVGSQLDVVDILITKTTSPCDVTYEIPDLVEILDRKSVV